MRNKVKITPVVRTKDKVENPVNTQVTLTKTTYEALVRAAKTNKVTKSMLINTLLTAHVKSNKTFKYPVV